MEFNLQKTLEALLLSTAEPISMKELVKLFARYHEEVSAAAEEAKESTEEDANDIEVPSLVTQAELREALTALTDAAEVEDKTYRIVEGPNGYQIVTAPQYAEFVRLLRGEPRPMKLSPAALETMSIIAYRQPVTRAEMEAIRGVSVDSALNKLLELEMVHVTGRAELPGRPIQYGTTDKFLEFTGIKDLDEFLAKNADTPHLRSLATPCARRFTNSLDVRPRPASSTPTSSWPTSSSPSSGLCPSACARASRSSSATRRMCRRLG